MSINIKSQKYVRTKNSWKISIKENYIRIKESIHKLDPKNLRYKRININKRHKSQEEYQIIEDMVINKMNREEIESIGKTEILH